LLLIIALSGFVKKTDSLPLPQKHISTFGLGVKSNATFQCWGRYGMSEYY